MSAGSGVPTCWNSQPTAVQARRVAANGLCSPLVHAVGRPDVDHAGSSVGKP